MRWERYTPLIKRVEKNINSLSKGGSISFDIDGVIQATYLSAILLASHELQVPISYSMLTSYWELANIAQKKPRMIKDPFEFARITFNQSKNFLESPPLPGAISFLKILRQSGINPFFISSRPAQFLEETLHWFGENLPWINPQVIHLKHNPDEDASEFKSRKIRELNVKLHFEDSLEEAERIAAQGINVILVPHPWNSSFNRQRGRIGKILRPTTEGYNGMWPVLDLLCKENLE